MLAEALSLLGKSGRHCFGGDQYCSKIGDLPPHLRRIVTDTLAGVPEMPDGWIRILVPVSGEDYLFLSGTPRSAYMDLRSGSLQVDTILRTKQPYTTYFRVSERMPSGAEAPSTRSKLSRGAEGAAPPKINFTRARRPTLPPRGDRSKRTVRDHLA